MADSRQDEQNSFFDRLYGAQYYKMYRYAMTILSNQQLAAEVVQDSFLEALLRIDELMSFEKPERWLLKVVKNKTLHVLRSQARDARRLLSLNAEGVIELPGPDFLAQVEEDELTAFTQTKQKITEALTANELYLLKRIALERVSYQQLSEETGLTIANCQKRIQRIRRKLKKYLSKEKIL